MQMTTHDSARDFCLEDEGVLVMVMANLFTRNCRSYMGSARLLPAFHNPHPHHLGGYITKLVDAWIAVDSQTTTTPVNFPRGSADTVWTLHGCVPLHPEFSVHILLWRGRSPWPLSG